SIPPRAPTSRCDRALASEAFGGDTWFSPEVLSMAGVKVIVREPRRAAAAIAPDARKVERDALVAELCAKHRPSVVATIVRLGNIARDKAEDVAQKVLLLLREEIEEFGPPPSVPAFLASTIRF